jgi:hypothetical protein
MCHRATAGGWIQGVLDQYVAGPDPRGRPEGQSYPRSQQTIREIFGLMKLPTFSTTLQEIITLNWTAVVEFKTIALL